MLVSFLSFENSPFSTSEPQFPYLKYGNSNSTYPTGLL